MKGGLWKERKLPRMDESTLRHVRLDLMLPFKP